MTLVVGEKPDIAWRNSKVMRGKKRGNYGVP